MEASKTAQFAFSHSAAHVFVHAYLHSLRPLPALISVVKMSGAMATVATTVFPAFDSSSDE